MDLMHAELIYDGYGDEGEVLIPDRMLPEDGLRVVQEASQLQGTPAERLSEMAGRICYDSFSGKGRNSADYHKHILDVKHSSVYGHYNFTVTIPLGEGVNPRDFDANIRFERDLLSVFINRPGVWAERVEDFLRVTCTLRAVVEWHVASKRCDYLGSIADLAHNVGESIRNIGRVLAPQVILEDGVEYTNVEMMHVEPKFAEERWVSLLLTGSRGFSHEVVRHGYRTGMSQRSTRYVDEDGSPYVPHPLLALYTKDKAHDADAILDMHNSVEADRKTYSSIVEEMQPWLVGQGSNKFDARKQSRGAARGFLGNALYTELVFSASIAQWHRIFLQRCGGAADAEIRTIMCQALAVLKDTRYGDYFNGWEILDSGMGQYAEYSE